MAPASVHLSIDEIQHTQQLPTLVTMGQHQRRHATDTELTNSALDWCQSTIKADRLLAKVKVDPHAKNQGQMVKTGECPQQIDTRTQKDGHAHTWMLSNVLSPLLRGR